MTNLSTFDIRDESGHVFNQTNKPTVVFDKSCGTLLKIGDYADMLNYFNVTQAAYRRMGFHDIADDVTLLELPRDQEIIDKVFQNTGYLLSLYKQMVLN